jgi:hypothetical protein
MPALLTACVQHLSLVGYHEATDEQVLVLGSQHVPCEDSTKSLSRHAAVVDQ